MPLLLFAVASFAWVVRPLLFYYVSMLYLIMHALCAQPARASCARFATHAMHATYAMRAGHASLAMHAMRATHAVQALRGVETCRLVHRLIDRRSREYMWHVVPRIARPARRGRLAACSPWDTRVPSAYQAVRPCRSVRRGRLLHGHVVMPKFRLDDGKSFWSAIAASCLMCSQLDWLQLRASDCQRACRRRMSARLGGECQRACWHIGVHAHTLRIGLHAVPMMTHGGISLGHHLHTRRECRQPVFAFASSCSSGRSCGGPLLAVARWCWPLHAAACFCAPWRAAARRRMPFMRSRAAACCCTPRHAALAVLHCRRSSLTATGGPLDT